MPKKITKKAGKTLLYPDNTRFTPREIGSDKRLEMVITEKEYKKIGREFVLVTDLLTGEKWLAKKAACGQACYCDAVVKKPEPKAKEEKTDPYTAKYVKTLEEIIITAERSGDYTTEEADVAAIVNKIYEDGFSDGHAEGENEHNREEIRQGRSELC